LFKREISDIDTWGSKLVMVDEDGNFENHHFEALIDKLQIDPNDFVECNDQLGWLISLLVYEKPDSNRDRLSWVMCQFTLFNSYNLAKNSFLEPSRITQTIAKLFHVMRGAVLDQLLPS
jgi:hypothetical protein